MFVELDKDSATTEGTKELLRFDENEFIFYSPRREKVKFLRFKNHKDLGFLNMLRLTTWGRWSILIWDKKQ